MDNLYQSLQLAENSCLVCGSDKSAVLGVRGNREYSGADQNIEPHVVTNVVKCRKCGFIYINPDIQGADELERAHYSNPEVYQATKKLDPVEMFKKRIDIIRRFKPTGKLLDIGAGKGEFMAAARAANYVVKGVEPSKGLCEFANETYNLNVTHGLLKDIDHNEKYDIVTMNHVFEHVSDPHDMLDMISTILEKNGLLFIEVPNTDSLFLKIIDWYYKVKGLKWSGRLSPLHPPFHKYGYNEMSLTYILNKHNFVVNSVDTITGKDRGFEEKSNVKSFAVVLRNMATNIVNLLGNRELIIVTAKKK